jgi:hypothetical protein
MMKISLLNVKSRAHGTRICLLDKASQPFLGMVRMICILRAWNRIYIDNSDKQATGAAMVPVTSYNFD